MRLDAGEEEIDVVENEVFIKQCIDNYLDSVKVYEAINFAALIHKDQKYGKEPIIYPYFFHLDSVLKILNAAIPISYPKKSDLLIAGLLHDSIEDQSDKVSLIEIKEKFGENVATLVEILTDQKGPNGEALPRKERAKNLYPKLKSNDNALILKLADKIANVEFCITMASIKVDNLFNMYCKEHMAFKENLYNKNCGAILQKLWSHLDKLINEPNYFLR